MPKEVVMPMDMKCEKGCIKVRCPYCRRWNEAVQSKCYGLEKNDGEFVVSFYRTCINCEKELYFDLKTRDLVGEVLVEE